MTVAENIYANNEPRRFGIINDKKMLADCQNLLAELGIPLIRWKWSAICRWHIGNW